MLAEAFREGERALLAGLVGIETEVNLFGFLKLLDPFRVESTRSIGRPDHIFKAMLGEGEGIDFSFGNEDLSVRSKRIDIEEHTPAPGFSQEFFWRRGEGPVLDVDGLLIFQVGNAEPLRAIHDANAQLETLDRL